MKKLLYLLLLLPLALVTASCDDDDKVPDVSINTSIEGGVYKDGVIYVVQGTPLVLEVSLDNHTDKEGQLGVITFYWDHYLAGQAVTVPYTFEFPTAAQPVGNHLLQAEMPVYVVDYPLCVGYFDYVVKIVPSADDLPDAPATVNLPASIKKK